MNTPRLAQSYPYTQHIMIVREYREGRNGGALFWKKDVKEDGPTLGIPQLTQIHDKFECSW